RGQRRRPGGVPRRPSRLERVKDPALFRIVLEENFVLVTNNRDDFRALVGRVELHPGLVVIVENVRRAREMEFFAAALARILADEAEGRDMVNSVVEVTGDGSVVRYDLPPLA
ncbi:MAG TPA: DUF5615 family PIN-like protein, partial [Longimicrobium sp.]|nr:DUF5615 family PIN-like protein [Longimicrobium sp.]